MAAQKLIFLATLLLFVIGGSSLRIKCRSSKDCPRCDLIDGVCVDGFCSCSLLTTNDVGAAAAADATADCKKRSDCAKFCPKGCAHDCVRNSCICVC